LLLVTCIERVCVETSTGETFEAVTTATTSDVEGNRHLTDLIREGREKVEWGEREQAISSLPNLQA